MMFITLLAGFLLALLAPLIVRLSEKWSPLLLSAFPIAVFICFINQLPALINGSAISETVIWVPKLSVNLHFFLDGLSLLFVLIISEFGFFIILYARDYLRGEPQPGRFYSYLLFFMTSMIGVPLAENLITLFLFWELTGISSFLLISFYHEKSNSRKAAVQAIIITSSGALAMLAGFILMGQECSSYDLQEILSSSCIQESKHESTIIILLLVGAFSKSAQFPFHFWLPNAMVAPTPVSAYLHSATMVKAGIYLIARLNPLFESNITWRGLLIAAGTITMLLGATLALNKTDLKKILAYTTVSALGMMVLLIGIGTAGAIQAMIVFLIAHALYKGTLFLIAGNLDHETGSRDVDELSGLRKRMPWTSASAILACLSMSGIIPFIGFAGKELIYEAILETNEYPFLILGAVILSSAVFTSLAIKIGYRIFFGTLQSPKENIHESTFLMIAGPILLSLSGLLFGLIPEKLIQPLLNISAIQIVKDIRVLQLSLWHGFNLVLLLSFLTLIAGFIFYYYKHIFLNLGTKIKFLEKIGPDSLYEKTWNIIFQSSYKITRLIQNGYLRVYMATLISVFLGIILYVVFISNLQNINIDFPAMVISKNNIYEWIICVFITAGIAKSLATDSRVTALASMGVAGYGIALIFIIYSAPDAAMTQFLVETLTVVLFVLVLHKLPYFEKLLGKTMNLLYLFLSLLFGTTMSCIILLVTAQPMQSGIKSFIGENSLSLGQGRNMVNVILVDFRAMDTLGESIVLAIASTGIYILLKLRIQENENYL